MTEKTPLLSRLVVRQGGRCFYCPAALTTDRKIDFNDREAMARERESGVRAATHDHFVPRMAGGDDHWPNFVAACGPCNQDKAGRLPTLSEIVRFVELFCVKPGKRTAGGGPLLASLTHRARRIERALAGISK